MNVYEMARQYLKRGWSVIPVRNDGSKAPNLQTWKEYRDRYATEEELKEWFLNTKNWIGIVTGKLSNLSVLDMDSKEQPPCQSSYQVSTPKGRHLYFQYAETLRNWVKPTDQDWDIRTEGGFVCSAPSPGYRWNNGYLPRVDVPLFPIHLLGTPEVQKQAPRVKGRLNELLGNLKEGVRDDSFTRAIGYLHRELIPADDIITLLRPYAESSGFGLLELEKKVRHITEGYKNEGKPTQKLVEDMSIGSFLSRVERTEWLCQPFFSKQSLSFIVGLPEALKSWLIIDLALELARGGEWLGRFKTKQSKVLYLDQERPRSETQRRFAALMAEKGISLESLSAHLYVDCPSSRKLDLDVSFDSFKRELEEIRPDVVIIDSFVTIHTKSENDRMEIQKILDKLKTLREQFGCSFIFINHEGKAAYQDAKENVQPSVGRMVGSIAVPAACESALTVKRLEGNTSEVFHTKNNLANKADSFVVSVVDTPKGIKVGVI